MKIAKRILAVFLAVTVVFSYCAFFANDNTTAKAANLTGDSNYLFAYFTGTSIEGQTIHLAVSKDGLNYTALRNNDPVIVPSKGTGCVRDPYLWYNENDGYYYILATDLDFTDTGSDYSDNSESFIVWRSKDLVNWYDETMIDVKAILGRLGINNNNMQAVWAPQVLWDGSEFVVYFSLQCDGTSNGSWNPLTIVYLKTSNLLDESKYDEYGVIHNPGRHVIDADIIKKPGTNQYYMFYKDESASGGIQSIYYMISDNGPTGPYYAPNNANDGRGPQLFADIGQNLEGCNSFFDDDGNLLTLVDEYGYFNSLTNQNEAHFHVSKSSDFSTFTTLPDSSHNINTLSPRHGSVVKITDEEYNRLLAYSSEITSSSFPETEVLSDHLVGRYFTTADYTYNAANGKNDLTLTDGAISTATDSDGDYYAYFNAAGAEINLASLISGDLNIKDGFTITFSASTPLPTSTSQSNTRFFDISNNWSQRANPDECYLHMSPVADSNGLYVGAFNGPVTTNSWTWASQGNNYNDGIMHDYIISFADGNMILYIDGELAMKRDRYNMCAEYGDNFLTDNWFKEIGNSIMRIGKSEWSDPLFTGSMQNLCIYDCSLSYYDVQKMQKQFDAEAGKTTIAKIAVPETVYMKPVNGASTVGQYYVNNRIHDGSNEVHLEVNPAQTNGVVEFYIPGAKHFIIEVNTVTSGIGDIVLGEAGKTSENYEGTKYNAAANGYFSYTTAGLYISGTGMNPGTTALAEWKITVIMQDGSQTTHYAYSTLYAPYLNPVGSAILLEGRYYSNNKLYASSMAWVSGVHGFTNNPAANYYARTDTMVPLLGAIGTGDNEDNPDTNWISASAGSNTLSTASFRYNKVTGSSGKLGAIGVYRSPVANLTIDTSRYTNFNQIPNLTVGFNYTDKENSGEVYWYVSDYTDGNMTYMTDYSKIDSRDNVNTQAGYYYNIQGELITNTGVNQAQVSTGAEHNARWDRPVKSGDSNQYIFKTGAYAYRSYLTGKGAAYSVNYILVNGTNVDKTELRNLVLKSTFFNESNYTTTSWNNYKTALQNAALALGDPSKANVDSYETALQNAINALQTTITLNANGGKINGAATTAYNVTIGAEASVTSDLSAYVPVRNGYRFKGWAASTDAESGAMTVTTGFMPTLYAVWEEILSYTVAYNANGGSGSIANVTVEFGKSITLPSSGFTREGYSLIGWSTNSTATTATYAPGQTVSGLASSSGETVTLYAVWAEYKYTVVYDANGGSGSIASVTVRVSETFTLASAGFTKAGYNLNGWATTASATAPEYQLGQSVSKLSTTNGATVTLYAVWVIDNPLVADVVILDFATPIDIDPISNDESLKKNHSSYSVVGISANENSAPDTTLSGEYGNFAVVNNIITYTPAKVMNGVETICYHVKTANNSTYTETITVGPASSILYEETAFAVKEGSTGAAWANPSNTSATNAKQNTTLPQDNVVGFDSSYNKFTNYSNGTALSVTVDTKNRTSQNLTLDFVGKGIDVYGVCGNNTGVQIISISDKATGKNVKSFIVDTYYGDTYGTLHQVPIVNDTSLDYGEYKIQIVASYLPTMSGAVKASEKAETQSVGDITATTVSVDDDAVLREALAEIGMDYVLDADQVEVIWFDDDSVLNGGMGASAPAEGTVQTAALTSLVNVIDSVRIYHPLSEDDAEILPAEEKNAVYYNVIDNLLNEENGQLSTDSIFAYVSGKDMQTLTISNYNKIGPKDEVYLVGSDTATNAITFSIDNYVIGSTKVYVSLRAAYGSPMVKIGDEQFVLSSNTEMYYDITDCAEKYNGVITIQNVSPATLLSIGSVKLAGESAQTASLATEFDLETAYAMIMAVAETVEPNVPDEDPVVPEDPANPDDSDNTDDSTNPEEPDNTDDSSSACWLIKIIKWIFNLAVKIVNGLIGILKV